jgi:lysophospholipid acyltransferase (LPLAT)-like uncharacterized protein
MRGGGTDHNWELLIDLAHKIEVGACVILTADGGGSAHLVKVGALALASATRVLLVPLPQIVIPRVASDASGTPHAIFCRLAKLHCLWAGSHD